VRAAANEIGRDARAMKKFGEACGDARPISPCKTGGSLNPSTKFPVRSKTFPVPAKKFPVLLRREFSCKPLNSLAVWTQKWRK
jgi:hypothetical protein